MPYAPTSPVLGTITRDYSGWLSAGGVDRLVDAGAPDLDDPAVYAAAVEQLFLAPYRLAFVELHRARTPGVDPAGQWADLLAAFVSTNHADTLDAVRGRTDLLAASLDGSHAGGCG
jgi:hypothetical protein